VLQSLLRLQPSLRIPSQAGSQEIQECLIVALQRALKSFGAGTSATTLGANSNAWLAHGVEEQLFAAALFDKVLLGGPKDFHDARELFLLVFPWEDRITSKQLGEDTSQAPHIDRNAIAHTQDNFG
jgi:hypothetical protein